MTGSYSLSYDPAGSGWVSLQQEDASFSGSAHVIEPASGAYRISILLRAPDRPLHESNLRLWSLDIYRFRVLAPKLDSEKLGRLFGVNASSALAGLRRASASRSRRQVLRELVRGLRDLRGISFEEVQGRTSAAHRGTVISDLGSAIGERQRLLHELSPSFDGRTYRVPEDWLTTG